jgi:oxygen-independent coproporphyrinogen-3 oxidase
MHDRIDSYFKALNSSIMWQLEQFGIAKGSIETLFIGGGTPSVAAPKHYDPIFKTIMPYLQDDCEITIEANPNSATKEWLESIYSLGVNRVSFGVQSFNDKKLQILNRAHSSKEAKDAIIEASKAGFKNISIDIIYDLAGDTKELIYSDIKEAMSLPINHISTYELTIEKATQFSKMPNIKANRESLNFFVRDTIKSSGFEWYEVSNYGTYQSKHNIGYWKHNEYLGVGAGAVGFYDNFRYYPHTNIEKFISEPFYYKKESLSEQEILTEKIFLGLRSIVGVSKEILTPTMQNRADILVDEGRLELRDETYFNNDYFLSDEIALFIMQN